MPAPRRSSAARYAGEAAAVASAFAYGITVVIGRDLASSGVGFATGLGVRFGVAAVTLFALLVLLRRPVLPAPGERVTAFLLGAIGYAVESSFFYLGLAHGSAAAVSLLFYAYPPMVAVIETVLTRRGPPKPVVVALGLAAAGTALLTAAGQRLDITTAGIAFSLCSAVSIAVYVVVAERSMRRTDALTSGAWVACGAALALLTRARLAGPIRLPRGVGLEVIGYGVATAAAFVLLFVALRRIGPSRASVIMTLEALFATLLAAGFLGEPITPLHAVGGGAILAGAVVAALAPVRSAGRASAPPDANAPAGP